MKSASLWPRSLSSIGQANCTVAAACMYIQSIKISACTNPEITAFTKIAGVSVPFELGGCSQFLWTAVSNVHLF